MIAAQKEEERLALEAAKPADQTVDAAKTDGDTEVPEGLELVEAPPNPDDFNRGRSR